MKAWGTGRLYRRGGTWWIQFSHRGELHRESSRSRVRADAAKLLRARLAEISQGRLLRRSPEKVTFQELEALYEADYIRRGNRSWARVEYSLKHLRPVFGKLPAVAITYEAVARYITVRTANSARATVFQEVCALGRMRRLGFLAGLLPHPTPLPTIKLDNVRQGFFSDEEVMRVLRHLPDWYTPAIEFAWRTGWRIGEVKGLMWARVDFRDGMVRLEPGTTKNRQGRMFPFGVHPQLNALLVGQRERTKEWQQEHAQVVPWVFWRSGQRLGDHRDTWTRACRQAGLPGRLVHDLRRTAVRNLERAAIPRSTAMRITGHLTESVYRRYAISSDADMVEAVRKLAATQPACLPSETTSLPAVATGSSTEQAQS
jgi:integrase